MHLQEPQNKRLRSMQYVFDCKQEGRKAAGGWIPSIFLLKTCNYYVVPFWTGSVVQWLSTMCMCITTRELSHDDCNNTFVKWGAKSAMLLQAEWSLQRIVFTNRTEVLQVENAFLSYCRDIVTVMCRMYFIWGDIIFATSRYTMPSGYMWHYWCSAQIVLLHLQRYNTMGAASL